MTGHVGDDYYPVTIGDKVDDGKYTIVRKLGQGVNSTVWLAYANRPVDAGYGGCPPS